MDQIAIVGTGLIGRAWAIVFARAGHAVRLWDADAAVVRRSDPHDRRHAGRPAAGRPDRRGRRRRHAAHRGGAAPSNWRSTAPATRRRASAKTPRSSARCSRASTRLPPPDASCELDVEHSGVGLHRRPAWTAPLPGGAPGQPAASDSGGGAGARAVDDAARRRPRPGRCSRAPARCRSLVRREVPGFLINRLQASLLREAWRLVGEGYCSVEDLDRCVRDGLGLRWALMGPFETIDLNAPGGVRRLRGALRRGLARAAARHALRAWSDELIEPVDAERRAVLPRVESGRAQRLARSAADGADGAPPGDDQDRARVVRHGASIDAIRRRRLLPRWDVTAADAGVRLDKFLAAAGPCRLAQPRRHRARARPRLRQRGRGGARRRRRRASDGRRSQSASGRTVPAAPRRRPARANAGGLRIVFEDDDLIVLDKPAGLLSVPLDARDAAASLFEQVEDYLRREREAAAAGRASHRPRHLGPGRLRQARPGPARG